MSQENLQLQLFKRIKDEARWLRLRPDIFDDVVQEAWLLALDYAEKKGKGLDDFSKTEIKYRCLEAKRKIAQPHKEISVDEEWFSSAPANLITSQEIVREETPESSQGKLDRLDWILSVHPSLRLTNNQLKISNLLLYNGKRGWQTSYANKHGISRQAVNKTTVAIKNKITWANDLLRLIDGDIDYFFEVYGQQWNSPLLRSNLNSLFRPQLGTEINQELVELLKPLKKSMMTKSINLIEKEIRGKRFDGELNSKNIALSTNIFYLADNMKHSSLTESVAENIWNISKDTGPFFDIAFGLYEYLYQKGNWVKRYNEWLIDRLVNNDSLGRSYADYHLAYYRAIPQAKIEEFMIAKDHIDLGPFSYTKIISNTYNNIRNSFYAHDSNLLDMNFLRFLAIKKYYPLNPNTLSLNNRQSLKTIAQKLLHSENPFVISEAEKLLNNIKI